MSLHFDDIGDGNPVILIHGFPLSGKMWKPQVEQITGAGFRLILPDLYAFGANQHLPDTLTMENMAKEIADLLNNLKIEKAIIGGLSLGGYVTFNLFRNFPEKFAAVVLCDTTFRADTEQKRAARFELIEQLRKEGNYALIEKMLPNLISEDTKQNNSKLMVDLRKSISEINTKAAIAVLRGMAERIDSSDLLSRMTIPAALIFGEHDQITNLENAKQMQQKIPDSILFTIPKAGHLSNLEQPEQFNKVLVNFLQKVDF